MSAHPPKIDDNNPAVDAAQAMGLVAVPFLVAVFIGLIVLGGVPFLGASADHGGEHAPAAH